MRRRHASSQHPISNRQFLHSLDPYWTSRCGGQRTSRPGLQRAYRLRCSRRRLLASLLMSALAASARRNGVVSPSEGALALRPHHNHMNSVACWTSRRPITAAGDCAHDPPWRAFTVGPGGACCLDHMPVPQARRYGTASATQQPFQPGGPGLSGSWPGIAGGLDRCHLRASQPELVVGAFRLINAIHHLPQGSGDRVGFDDKAGSDGALVIETVQKI
jgi:hypothetical protein